MGWIMSEEDLVLKLLKWLKSLKRVSVRKACDYINNVLLAREGRNLMLEKYGLTLPISTSTTHSWLINSAANTTACATTRMRTRGRMSWKTVGDT